MKKQALLVGLMAVTLFAGIPSSYSQGSRAASGGAADERTTREIAAQINQRHAALARFDKDAYSEFIDQLAVFAEPGDLHTGAQQIAEARPTVGYKMVVEHESPKVTSFGQTAIAIYRQSEKEIFGQQSLTSRFIVVDTYIKKDGSWVLVAHVELPEPVKRQAVKVNPAVLPQYAGQYEYGPGFVDTISVSGGKLMAQQTNEDKPVELLALNETTFFEDGDADGLVVFEKDASGKVSHYVYRARGQELIAKKIK
jgi:Domain of unknown function (DUF4440)/Domain of unknown function (DUF3471)